MKDCKYPNCMECAYDDCAMEDKDIAALLKRRRYSANPTAYRQNRMTTEKEQKKIYHIAMNVKAVRLSKKEKTDGFRRLCIAEMRLIEQKVSNSPQWCRKRTPSKDYLKRRENILRKKKEKYNKEHEIK